MVRVRSADGKEEVHPAFHASSAQRSAILLVQQTISIEEAPHHSKGRRGRRRVIAEVSAEYAVPTVSELVTGRWRSRSDEWLSIN